MSFNNLQQDARLASEVVRLHAREAQLSTIVSAMQSQETKLQGQLQNLHEENTRTNAPMNQIQMTNSSFNMRKQELTQQLRTSILELSRVQTGVSHLRISVGRHQPTEHRDAEILELTPLRYLDPDTATRGAEDQELRVLEARRIRKKKKKHCTEDLRDQADRSATSSSLAVVQAPGNTMTPVPLPLLLSFEANATVAAINGALAPRVGGIQELMGMLRGK